MRLLVNQGVIHYVLLIGEAKVSPLRYISTPILELVAATLSVEIALLLREELDIEINKKYFWTDSKVVFKIFVANRIQFIRDHSDFAQCYYVPSTCNPADYSSSDPNGIQSSKSQRGFKGPSFLSLPEGHWPNQVSAEVSEGNPKIKPAVAVNLITIEPDLLSPLEGGISSCEKIKKVLAHILKLKTQLLQKNKQKKAILTSHMDSTALIDVEFLSSS